MVSFVRSSRLVEESAPSPLGLDPTASVMLAVAVDAGNYRLVGMGAPVHMMGFERRPLAAETACRLRPATPARLAVAADYLAVHLNKRRWVRLAAYAFGEQE
jgi:hypothetical protein